MSWLNWNNAGLIEVTLVFGVVLLFIGWEISRTNRAIREDQARGDAGPEPERSSRT